MSWPTENEAAYLRWLNGKTNPGMVTLVGAKLDERHLNLERGGFIKMRWADGGANICVQITDEGRRLIDPRSRAAA